MLLMKEMGAGPELSRILLSAISHPQAPHPTADAFALRYFSGKDAPFVKNLSASRAYLWLGDYDRVGADKELSSDSHLHWELGFPGFRNSPGFKRLIERLGVLGYWRKQGFPPQCHALGATDFTCVAPGPVK